MKKKPKQSAGNSDDRVKKYKSRIKQFHESLSTDLLIDHPDNWRIHPEHQRAMLGSLLDRHGKIDAIIAYRSERYGGLVIIDGHQRRGADAEYPVIELDVTDEEAAEILLTYNPLSELATTDKDAYRDLMAAIDSQATKDTAAIARLAESVLGESLVSDDEKVEKKITGLRAMNLKAHPKMIWTVIGVPVSGFGAINTVLEQCKMVDGVMIETVASDWMPEQ